MNVCFRFRRTMNSRMGTYDVFNVSDRKLSDLPIMKGFAIMLRFVKRIIGNKYLWLIFVPLLIGWFLLTSRLQERTYHSMTRQMDSVKKIWGGNLEQPMPSIRYKRFGSDVSILGKGRISASSIVAKLEVDYRKKGLVFYTGYNADFTGKYLIRNPENEKIYLSFIFPYPTEREQGMLRDVKLLVNGKEQPEDTEYQQNLALWTGLLDAGGSLEITVSYKGRGLNHFIYGFEPGKPINKFEIKIEVSGAKDIDYPVSTMSPTRTEDTADGKILVWELDRLLTQLNIGVILPDRINISKQIAVMVARAPFFFLLFLFTLIATLKLSGYSPNFVHIAMSSAAYFLFYPLFAYLSMYMHTVVAFILSFGILGGLICNYFRIINNKTVAAAVGIAYTFYLGITSLAALLPTYTGLILVIEGVVLLAIMMQIFSRFRNITVSELLGLADMMPRQTPEIITPSDETKGEKDEKPQSV